MSTEGLAENLRWVFVSFLFALVTGKIAEKFSTLIRRWNKVGVDRLPALLHLILAAVVVVTSWVGWSIETKSDPSVGEVFGWPTWLLILDIALLICYFVLVSGIKVGTHVPNDAVHVAWWSMWILLLYVLWDFTVGSLVPPRPGSWCAQHVGVSLACAFLAILFFFLVRGGRIQSSSSVCWADVALISLFLLFRAWKQYSYPGGENRAGLALPNNVVEVCAGVFFVAFMVTAILAGYRGQTTR
jgi:hypothetical protein